MRDPRPGIAWSQRRMLRRVAYGCWMDSPQWKEVRCRWHEEWVRRYGCPPTCVLCDGRWGLAAGDLHHRTYRRLGRECFEDLVPVDRTCHECIHRVWESNPAWRRMDRALANDLIVGLLRNARTPMTEQGL